MSLLRSPLSERFKPQKLLDKVTLVIMVLVIVQMISLGAVFSNMIYEIVEQQTQQRALEAAQHIALIPELQVRVRTSPQSEFLTLLAESIRQEAEATQIVVTDRHGIQIFNTDSEKIGSRYLQPEDSRALRHGRSYVSKSHGRQGAIISGHAPILDAELNPIGMVSVSYRVANVLQLTNRYLEKELFYIWIFITLGLIAAILIARAVKHATFGLEPQEIATLFQEREAIIASIREGIVATDAQGKITLLNETARKSLGETAIGRPIERLLPDLDLAAVFHNGAAGENIEAPIQGTEMIVNLVPIQYANKIKGTVATFRPKDEVDLMARELSQIQSYSEMLRAQTHEYSNRLHAIVGMIQMEAYDDVLDFIAEETTGHRNLIRQLIESVPDSTLSSFLIGSYMHAMELKIDFVIDPETHLVHLPEWLSCHQLVTILGNVLNNAFDAALGGESPPKVKLFMSDYGNDLIFEVEDSGPGIPEQFRHKMFDRGVSTKPGGHRGYGLHLVKKTLQKIDGGISIQHSELGGALFVIEIPKRKTA